MYQGNAFFYKSTRKNVQLYSSDFQFKIAQAPNIQNLSADFTPNLQEVLDGLITIEKFRVFFPHYMGTETALQFKKFMESFSQALKKSISASVDLSNAQLGPNREDILYLLMTGIIEAKNLTINLSSNQLFLISNSNWNNLMLTLQNCQTGLKIDLSKNGVERLDQCIAHKRLQDLIKVAGNSANIETIEVRDCMEVQCQIWDAINHRNQRTKGQRP